MIPTLAKAVRAVFRPPESIYRHLHFRGEIMVPVNGSSFRMIHHGYQLENELFWKGLDPTLRLWAELCKNSRTILDIGANTGVYSLVAKCVNPDAFVAAFEPVPKIFERLKRNVELNGYSIALSDMAASDSTGRTFIYDAPSEHTYSASLNRAMLGDAASRAYQVGKIRLDEWTKPFKIQRVDLIKIDVEMHEPEVLRGMGKLLESRPAIILEVLTDSIGSLSQEILRPLGYRFFRIEDCQVQEVAHMKGGHALNYFATIS